MATHLGETIHRWISSFALLFCGAGYLLAADFFVSPAGRADATGTFNDPWTLESALAHPGAVSPGDTIYLRGGIYTAPDRLLLRSRLTGTPGAYITVRVYRRERARIDGGLEIYGAHVIFRDLEVMNSRTKRVSAESGPFPTDIPQPPGITVFAPDVKIVNNVVHDTSTGLASWKEASDNEFYGNIVYHNGWMGTDRAHGHGAYMQNKDGKKLLIDNIVFNQFELGLQIYGTSSTFLNNFYLEGNVLFNNGSLGGRFSRNLLLGGTIRAERPSVVGNWTYYPLDSDHGGENNIGYYAFGAGCSDLQLDNNYFVSGSIALTLFECSITSFKKNVLIGSARAFNPSTYPDNTYLKPAERPSENRIFVRPNRWEAGRAHLIVFNWRRDSEVRIDISEARLNSGDLYEIRDVQNLFGRPIATGIYRGEPITVPMTSSLMTTAVGEVPFPSTHTDREFGVFLLRKLVPGERTSNDTVVSAYFEAESGAIAEPMIAFQAEGASGGMAIASATPDSGSASFSIDVPVEDDYVIWVRLRSTDPYSARLATSIDDGQSEVSSHVSPALSTDWRWVRVNGRTAGWDTLLNPRVFHLEPGPHKITLSTRDSHFYVDTIFVSNDLNALYGDTEVLMIRDPAGGAG